MSFRRQSSVPVMQGPGRRSSKRYSVVAGPGQGPPCVGNGTGGGGYRRASMARPSLSVGSLGMSGPLFNANDSITTMGAVDTDSLLLASVVSVSSSGTGDDGSTTENRSRTASDSRRPPSVSCEQAAPIPEDRETDTNDVDANVFDVITSPDLPEDHRGAEATHVEPLDPAKLEKLPGYETVGYHRSESTSYIPPPPPDDTRQDNQPEEMYCKVKPLSGDEAQDLLLEAVAKRCCHGKSAARDMEITKISADSAFQYRLETFTEYRSATWEFEPFISQAGDEMDEGQIPLPMLPWDIPFRSTQDFRDEVCQIEVPNTTTIVPCHGCNGQGVVNCIICHGKSYLRCMTCQGSGKLWKADLHGHRRVESCWHCRGIGRKKCGSCGHNGRVGCQTCQGHRQVRCYIRMTIKYVNHTTENIVKPPEVPDSLVKKADAHIIYDETTSKAWPLRKHPEIEVCRLSAKTIDEHMSRCSTNGKILMQRQVLFAIPLTKCTYVWQDAENSFWVFGKDKQIYCPRYPQRLCWGCVLL